MSAVEQRAAFRGPGRVTATSYIFSMAGLPGIILE